MAEPRGREGNLPEDPGEDVTARARSPGAGTIQPPTAVTVALTPPQHTGALFSFVEQEASESTVSPSQEEPAESEAAAEQRQRSNATENIKELEDKQTVKMKTNREIIHRQKQLTCQLLEEIEITGRREKEREMKLDTLGQRQKSSRRTLTD
ncbi:hypothetical protein INR49_032420 [Caranx melampygus]|nr:hypothetical protein INR49_032420 [Caranx melampygus]